MRYLFLHGGREWSGTPRAFAAAARGLAERGHDVTFAAEPDSTVERVASQLAAQPGRPPLFTVDALTLERTWLGAAWALRQLQRSRQVQATFVHGNREHLVAAVARLLGGRSAIVRRVPVGQRLTLNLAGRVATWIAPTCYLFAADQDARTAILPRRTVARAIAPLGVRAEGLEPAEPSAASSYVVCLHDASSRSRAATAIRTIAMLAPRHRGLQLIVMGEGAYDDDLRMQGAALRSLNLIHFLGERDDALHVMRSAKLGWVVSDADTAAYGILDLMSLGVPVLAGVNTLAERYVLSNITGVLLPVEDVHLTSSTVAHLLSRDEERITMGRAARQRVQRDFSESAMIDGFERASALATRLVVSNEPAAGGGAGAGRGMSPGVRQGVSRGHA